MSNSVINYQKEQIRELLNSADSIGIIVSENQNTDIVGAALGLYLVLSASGKNAQIVSKKTPLVEVSNLFGIDKIERSFGGTTKILTISVPYTEGEIDKVSYNIEDDRLNVNLFAEEKGIGFSEKDISYIRKSSSPSLVITIGVGNQSEIEGLADLKSTKSIHIDRNALNSLSGDVTIIDPSFSSLSEIVTEIIMDLNLGYDIDAFQNLMDGITYATRNFSAQNTSAFAFEAAGFLLQNGARRPERQRDQRQRDQRDQRGRSFPNEQHFLNQQPKPRFEENRNVQSQSQNVQNVQAPPKPQFQEKVQEETINEDQNDEPSIPDEIPDDWFLPKVFKGGKKGN